MAMVLSLVFLVLTFECSSVASAYCLIFFLNYFLLENPRAFMITYIEKLIDSRTTHMNHPCLFNDSNLKSLFGMLDVTNHGYISLEQYRQGRFSHVNSMDVNFVFVIKSIDEKLQN